MHDDAQVRKALRFVDGARTVAFTLDGTVAGDSWKRIFVAYNDEPAETSVDLPAGEWNIVVNAERAGVETLATARGKVTLPPYSMLVAHARDGAPNQPARRNPPAQQRR
jgi:pullulanase